MTINAEWFTGLIEKHFGSRRALASKMKNRQGKRMDHPALVRMLSGERSMALDEAEQLAHLLEVSLIEVLENAGVKFDKPKRHGECPLCGK